MKARIEAIRCLSYREEQERYIVHGTASEYLLPEELVTDALEFVRLVEAGKIGSPLTTPQRSRLAELKMALEAADVALPGNELVARDPSWAAVRDAAQRFLDEYERTAEAPAG